VITIKRGGEQKSGIVESGEQVKDSKCD